MTDTTPAHLPPATLWARVRSGDFELLTGRELWLVGLLFAAVLTAVLWVVFATVEPPPPKRLSITTGAESGAYFVYGQKYAQFFKKHGITLDVLPSRGSAARPSRVRASGRTRSTS